MGNLIIQSSGSQSLKMHTLGTSLVVQQLRLCTPDAEGPGLIPGQGTRSHMHAATKSLHATTEKKKKILHAAAKTWHSQINKYLKKKKS